MHNWIIISKLTKWGERWQRRELEVHCVCEECEWGRKYQVKGCASPALLLLSVGCRMSPYLNKPLSNSLSMFYFLKHSGRLTIFAWCILQCAMLAFEFSGAWSSVCVCARSQNNTQTVFERHIPHLHMVHVMLQKGKWGAGSPETPTSRLKVELLRKPQSSRAAPPSQSLSLRQRVGVVLRSNPFNPYSCSA